ncbi:MAG TPA: hypothetical protein VIV14_08855, partial [Gammaproteobacteria bacterium]
MSIKTTLLNIGFELSRRRVIKASIAYLVAAWLIIEVSSIVFPALLLPEWAHRLVVILAVVAFPIVVILAWIFDVSPGGITRTEDYRALPSSNRATSAAGSAQRLPPPADTAVASICVLPFEVLSTDAEDAFIANGVCAEISRALSKLAGVRVIHRTSVSAVDTGQSPDMLESRLGVQYVLTGSLRRRGENIRIIVELADTASGTQLW